MLVVKQSLVPLSTDQLITKIENNELTTMFVSKGHLTENLFRTKNTAGLESSRTAFEKYPTMYRRCSRELSNFEVDQYSGRVLAK
jgi:hypothetical protein